MKILFGYKSTMLKHVYGTFKCIKLQMLDPDGTSFPRIKHKFKTNCTDWCSCISKVKLGHGTLQKWRIVTWKKGKSPTFLDCCYLYLRQSINQPSILKIKTWHCVSQNSGEKVMVWYSMLKYSAICSVFF